MPEERCVELPPYGAAIVARMRAQAARFAVRDALAGRFRTRLTARGNGTPPVHCENAAGARSTALCGIFADGGGASHGERSCSKVDSGLNAPRERRKYYQNDRPRSNRCPTAGASPDPAFARTRLGVAGASRVVLRVEKEHRARPEHRAAPACFAESSGTRPHVVWFVWRGSAPHPATRRPTPRRNLTQSPQSPQRNSGNQPSRTSAGRNRRCARNCGFGWRGGGVVVFSRHGRT